MSGTLSMNIKTVIVALLASFGLLVGMSFMTPQAVQADTAQDICLAIPGNEPADCPAEDDGSVAEDEISAVADTIINVFSLIIGIVSVIVIIVAGLRYIVSGGDSKNVTAAKNQILYAVVGIVIVLFAQTIVKYVVGKL